MPKRPEPIHTGPSLSTVLIMALVSWAVAGMIVLIGLHL